jgi:hypothetical protein
VLIDPKKEMNNINIISNKYISRVFSASFDASQKDENYRTYEVGGKTGCLGRRSPPKHPTRLPQVRNS